MTFPRAAMASKALSRRNGARRFPLRGCLRQGSCCGRDRGAGSAVGPSGGSASSSARTVGVLSWKTLLENWETKSSVSKHDSRRHFAGCLVNPLDYLSCSTLI